MIKIFLILIFFTTYVYAGSSVTKNWTMLSPPTQDNDTSMYNFMNFIYDHFNQSQIITSNPNGNTKAQAGVFIVYNNSGTYKFCIETTQPNGTTWKCANLT